MCRVTSIIDHYCTGKCEIVYSLLCGYNAILAGTYNYKGAPMSEDAANTIEEYYDKWDNNARRKGFIERMEHKLHTKERRSYHR